MTTASATTSSRGGDLLNSTRRTRRVALVVLSLAMSWVLAEIAFGLYNLAYRVPRVEQRVESGGRLVEGNPFQDAEFFQSHPLLGHHGVPSHHATRSETSVTTNARGFRGPLVSYDKAAGEKRIVLLGDSGVWGAEVGDSETLDTHLRVALVEDPTLHSVVDLGISGYGPDQSYLLFLLEGLREDPDYVILACGTARCVSATSRCRARRDGSTIACSRRGCE